MMKGSAFAAMLAVITAPAFAQEEILLLPRQQVQPFASNLQDVDVADINGDQTPDIVTVSYSDSKTAVMYNSGGFRPIFTLGAISAVGRVSLGPVSVVARDFDLDGDQDVVATGNETGLYENLPGNDAWRVARWGQTTYGEVFAGNFFGTPELEFVEVTGGRSMQAGFRFVELTGAPGARSFVTRATGGVKGGPVTVADLDGDGFDELIIGADPSVFVKVGPDYAVAVTPFTGITGRVVSAADFNNDGQMDLVVVNGANLTVQLKQAGGGYQGISLGSLPGNQGVGLTYPRFQIADEHKDGLPDLFLEDQVGNLAVLVRYRNQGGTSPQFVKGEMLSTTATRRLEVFHLNADNRIDVLEQVRGVVGFNNLYLRLQSILLPVGVVSVSPDREAPYLVANSTGTLRLRINRGDRSGIASGVLMLTPQAPLSLSDTIVPYTIPANAASTEVQLTYYIAPGTECGQSLEIVYTEAGADPGDTASVFLAMLGIPAARERTVTDNSQVVIPDEGAINRSLATGLPEGSTVKELFVNFSVIHPVQQEVRVTLVAPGEPPIPLKPLNSALAELTPQGYRIKSLEGKPAPATLTLQVEDIAIADIGSLQSWSARVVVESCSSDEPSPATVAEWLAGGPSLLLTPYDRNGDGVIDAADLL